MQSRPAIMNTAFLSTLSLRRATHLPGNEWDHIPISIHALLAESDEHAYQLVLWVLRFLSTLSLRRATVDTLKLARPMLFLSTLSLRRATSLLCYMILRL